MINGMAENFKRRFSFRHLSFRKAKKQPIRPRSSIDVTDSKTELKTEFKRSASVRPASASRERSGGSSVRRDAPKRPSVAGKPIRSRSSIDLTDSSRTEVKRRAPLRPASSSRERSGASSVRRDVTKRSSSADWNDVWSKPTIGQALHSFTAILRCDLTFEAGDQILILTRTSKQFDWWEGTVRGQTGIFPANFIQVLD
eukprot:XP_011678670.1 PREDICTED: SH3 domain-containing YSC84-like protein 1 [Strongylocentrotus purpuratus]